MVSNRNVVIRINLPSTVKAIKNSRDVTANKIQNVRQIAEVFAFGIATLPEFKLVASMIR